MKPEVGVRRRHILKLESDLIFWITGIALKLALEYTYYVFVAPMFGYAGFEFDWSAFRYLEGWSLVSILLIIAPRLLKKPSDFFSAYALYFILIPAIVYFQFTSMSREPIYYLIASFLILEVTRSGQHLAFPKVRGGLPLLVVGLVCLIFLVSVWMYISGGARYFNLNILLIYEFRDQVDEIVNQGLMGYLITWAFKVATPVLLALALYYQKYTVGMIVFLTQILWFGVLGHKSILFFPLITIFLWALYARSRSLSLIGIAANVLTIISLLIFLVFDDIIAASLLVRRIFFVPPQLTSAYFEFFKDNGFLYWSNSIAGAWVDYPYAYGPAEVIGYFVGSGAFANNSFFASGYMHAGFLGMCLYSATVGFILRIIDGLAKDFDTPWLPLAFVAGPFITMFMSSDLLTVLLTHGLAFAVIALFVARPPDRISVALPENEISRDIYLPKIER
jgi:hypothetical protein